GIARGGVRVTRVHPFPTAKGSVAARAAGFAGFTTLATATAVVARGRPDAVLAMSPPITLGLAGWAAARRWRAPLVFNLQDIFPDAAIDTGAIRGGRLVAAARRLERFIYHRAAAVTVLSDDMRANVAAKLDAGRSGSVRVIPNFVDISRIRPRSRDTAYRAEHGLGDRTVVMYAGNVGLSQPLDLLVAAARAHRHRDDVVFVVNGEGSARPALEASAAGLPNVVFVGYQPAERLDEVLASADIHVVVLREGLARSSVPSKIYSILAAGRPVVASVDPHTELPRMIDEAGCGVAVAPGDQPAFDAAVATLVDDPGGRDAMGRRGRAYVERCMSPQTVAGAYEALFSELSRH
ncbi:MAG: glycosyltransferase family 4 protein, partial [Acidimicrobiaceae bacterium]|nr:glycosyltransferase family 4 protein [Acidimicrobiaceae bacterium]